MADAGLTRGGFHSYFESKSDLYAEALACFFTDPGWKSRWQGVQVDLNAADVGPQIVRAYLSPLPHDRPAERCRARWRKREESLRGLFKAMVDVLVGWSSPERWTIGPKLGTVHSNPSFPTPYSNEIWV
jgi:AcrR family transcriptional regulator